MSFAAQRNTPRIVGSGGIQSEDFMGSGVSVTKAGGSKAATSPFPAAFADPLTAVDPKLTAAFQGAIAAVKTNPAYSALANVDGLPMIIVALNDDGTRPFASSHDNEMSYTCSVFRIT